MLRCKRPAAKVNAVVTGRGRGRGPPAAKVDFSQSTLIRIEPAGPFVYCEILHSSPIKYSVRGGRADAISGGRGGHVTPSSGSPGPVTHSSGGSVEEDSGSLDSGSETSSC